MEKFPRVFRLTSRLGITNKPLLTSTNVDYLPVLHVLLRVFDWSLKVIYHCRACLSSWKENTSDQAVLSEQKTTVQYIIEQKTGIKVD